MHSSPSEVKLDIDACKQVSMEMPIRITCRDIRIMSDIRASDLPAIASEVHLLASQLGVLGLRWFAIRQSLLAEVATADTAAIETTLKELRDTIRRLSDLTKPKRSAEGTPAEAPLTVQGPHKHE